MSRPTLGDVLEARKTIAAFLSRTPLYSYPQINRLVGTEVYIKHEDHQPTRSFKVRGGINFLAHLSPEMRKKGVITASTGNHALSIAYACRLFAVEATIVMPQGANPVKVMAVENLGAKVVFYGKIFEEAKEFAERVAAEKGIRFIHPANEPWLIAGVATYALEIFEDQPQIEAIIVPVGGGSGASGCCLVKEALGKRAKVIGVQAAKAPAAYLSWKEKKIVTASMATVAEGLQTKMGYELTQSILWDLLDDFILVTDEEMEESIWLYLENIRTLTEHAGASPLAAALKMKDQLKGRKIALILSGGNLSPNSLRHLLLKFS
ncbi:MAG: threonine/serine dehydratase [Candidatus Aminicenantes bacterium]|nr:threonine/serine dehydratase [Candidatus Aminicenantes bacterium]